MATTTGTTNASDVTAGTDATAASYNNLRKDGYTGTGLIRVNDDAATVTFDLSLSKNHQVTLGGNRTLALSNGTVGQTFTIKLIQDATGSRTVTWFSGISWAGGLAPVLTTTANKADRFIFTCTGSGAYDGFVVGQNI